MKNIQHTFYSQEMQKHSKFSPSLVECISSFGKMYHQEIAFTFSNKSSVAFQRKFYTLIVQCYNFLAERLSKTIRYDKLNVTLICSRCTFCLDLFKKNDVSKRIQKHKDILKSGIAFNQLGMLFLSGFFLDFSKNKLLNTEQLVK